VSRREPPERADFAVVTVLPEEFEAVTRVFGLDSEVIGKGDGRLYKFGKVSSNDRDYNVVVTQSRERGNLASGICTVDLLARWKPLCLVVVGIAGGVKGRDNLALGDVVVSTALKYYSMRKETEQGTRPRDVSEISPSPILVTAYQSIGNEKWWEAISIPRPTNDGGEPKLIPGLIMAGEVIQGDPTSEELTRLIETYDKALAFEMESGGVSHALWERSGQLNVALLVIRGISDYCDAPNNQQTRLMWTEYSAEAAALAALDIVQHTQLEGVAVSPYEEYKLSFSHQLDKKYPEPSTPFATTFSDNSKTGRPVTDLLEIALTDKRALLQGAAGSGKSVAFGRIALEASQPGFIPIILNLKNWDPRESSALSNADSYNDQLDVLLRVSIADLNHNMIHGCPDHLTKVLFADALN